MSLPLLQRAGKRKQKLAPHRERPIHRGTIAQKPSRTPRALRMLGLLRRFGGSSVFPILLGAALLGSPAVSRAESHVPIDFLQSESKLSLDPSERSVRGTTTVRFEQQEPGPPIFHLSAVIDGITVDGRSLAAPRLVWSGDPNSEQMTVLSESLTAGVHTIVFSHRTTLTESSLLLGADARPFPSSRIDELLPVGEFGDTYRSTIEIEIAGDRRADVLSNGNVTRDGNRIRVEFPESSARMSPFLEIFDPSEAVRKTATLSSSDGRKIPLAVVAANDEEAARAIEMITSVLKRAEAIAGPYPHGSFVARITGADTSAHAGAVRGPLDENVLLESALASWFGAGTLPGGAGDLWIGSGIARWFGRSSETVELELESHRDLALQRTHTTSADPNTWAFAPDIIGHLDRALSQQGGLAARLPELARRFFGRALTTDAFYAFLVEGATEETKRTIGTVFDAYGHRTGSCEAPSLVPPPFSVGDSQVVFVDILRSQAELTLDLTAGVSETSTAVHFAQDTVGLPALDLLPDPFAVSVDGTPIDPALHRIVETPDRAARLRIIDRELDAGTHRVEIAHRQPLSQDRGVYHSFSMRDLGHDSRKYLEAYLPANLEHDRAPLSLRVRTEDDGVPYEILTNGALTTEKDGHRIEFPDYFTASSPFLVVYDPRVLSRVDDSFDSADGRTIPISVIAENRENAEAAVDIIKRVLAEGEALIGPYPHDRMAAHIWQMNEARGMEYAGAFEAILDEPTIRHETIHSWFARRLTPANGDAGWIDEGITTWIHKGFPQKRPFAGRTIDLAAPSPYQRETRHGAHGMGMEVIQELDRALASEGGMKPKLRPIFERFRNQPITVDAFRRFLKEISRESAHREIDRIFAARWYRTC